MAQTRPVHRNTQQTDTRHNDFRQGNGSRLYEHRLKHGFHNHSEWKYDNHLDYNHGNDQSRFFSNPHYEETPMPGHYGKGPRGYKRSDGRIYEEVCECLALDGYVDPSDIEVSVKDGVVTITGTVPARAMKYRAEDLIEEMAGVKELDSQIKVKSSHS